MDTSCMDLYYALLEEGAVLDDPNKFCGTVERMMSPCPPEVAIEAAVKILSPEITLPYGKATVLSGLYLLREKISHVALAKAFREVWIQHGLVTDTEYLLEVISWIKKKEDGHDDHRSLMTASELEAFQSLPRLVTVYRGVLNDPAKKEITGHSWTLNKKVADYYTACPGRENGWILTGEIPREHIHLLFLERGEDEVIIDIRHVNVISTEHGQATDFPHQLAEPWGFVT